MVTAKRVYGLTTPFVSVFPDPITKTAAPTAADKNYPNGFVWVYKNGDTRTTYMYGGLDSSGDAVWILCGPGASDVDTLTGDSGGAISPAAGNMTIAGGTNVTTVGAGSTITINLDAAIVLATSASSPIYTVAAATDMNINSATGQDIIMVLGDNAAANKFSIEDSDNVEVFAVDSNGGMTFSSLTVSGAFTQTAGVVSLSEDNSANAVGIANGTVARAVSLASSAAAHTVAIGSATGAASLDLKAGTGNFTLEGATASTYEISSTGINTGTCKFASGTGARTVEIAGGGTGIKTINIGAAATADVITIGTTTAAGATTISAGTGGLSLQSGLTVAVTAVNNAASPYALLGGDYVIAADTSGGAVTITLPAAPATGRTIVVVDEGAAAGANNITIDGNGKRIAAAGTLAAAKLIDSNYGTMTLYYTGTIWNAQDVA